MIRSFVEEKGASLRTGFKKGNSIFYVPKGFGITDEDNEKEKGSGKAAEKHSFLQYAVLNFRESVERCDMLGVFDGSWRGTLRLLEYLKGKKTKRGHRNEWTWKVLTDMVKYTPFPIVTSLLPAETDYLNRLAVDSFKAVMKYMGDLPLSGNQTEVECVYTILVICHHHPQLRDEVYCQLMKQTTNNKSLSPDSCDRGWRLLVLLTAFFNTSDTLRPYLLKYLEAAAQDYRRSEQATAEVCVHNLQQTMKYGGRRNVPTEQEVSAITRGEMSRPQTYFLPGGFKQALATTASTVVQDITTAICNKLGIDTEPEFSEFSLYCIVEGDTYTMPLENDEYVLDLVAELERNANTFYLIFCRSVWSYPLRLDSALYIEIIFHQVVPDYLEGFLLVTSKTLQLSQPVLMEISRIAALLHRSSGMNEKPTENEVVHLLPKPVLCSKQLSTAQWTEEVEKHWNQMTALNETEAKAQYLEIIHKWSLFGSCFFGVKMLKEDKAKLDYILAVNKNGANILDVDTHETIWRFSFAAVHSPHNVIQEGDTAYADIEIGDKTFMKCIRLQVDQAHEVSRLIQQYKDIQKRNTQISQKLSFPTVVIKI